MRFGKTVIGLFTAALVLTAVILGKGEYAWDRTVELTAQISAGGRTETIRSWEMEEGSLYLFLPAYARLPEVRLNSGSNAAFYMDGQVLDENRTCENLQLEVPYTLHCKGPGKESQYSLTILQSARLPALYIDTASGSMDYIHKKKGNEEVGTFRLYSTAGELHCAGNLDSIKGRGNTTWEYEKKPYSVTLDKAADLLGMGEANRWVLLANALDTSNLKNKLAYDMARDAQMAYSPECQWVDLYLNGAYAGLYLLSERNEVHEERVDISGESGFLVAKDLEHRIEKKGAPYITTDAGAALRIYHSALPHEEVQRIFQSAENAILAENGMDPVTGKHWQELIDMDSWVEKYLIEEILGSTDAGCLSQFYYFDPSVGGGKIYAGPIWDMDLTLRHSGGDWLKETDQFYGNLPHLDETPWLHALYEDAAFFERTREIYAETFLPLLQQLSSQGLDAYASYIEQAAHLNEIRWQTEPWENALEEVRTILDKRISFLNRVWIQRMECVVVTIDDYGGKKRSLVIEKGDTLPGLMTYAEDEAIEFYGWYYRDTDTPFDPQQPIYEDIEIELHYDRRS